MVNNERGNVTIMTLYFLVGVLAFSLLMMHFYGAFIGKRQAQNISDSAVMAATQELRNRFEQVMKIKVLDQLNNMEVEINQIIDACYDSIVDEDEDEEAEPIICPTREEMIENYISNPILLSLLINGNYDNERDWVLVIQDNLLGEFSDKKNGEVLYQVCLSNRIAIRNVALVLVDKNNGKPEVTFQFPVDSMPQLSMVGNKTVTTSDIITTTNDIQATGVAGIYADFGIDVSHKVPFNF